MSETIYTRLVKQADSFPDKTAIDALGRRPLTHAQLCKHVDAVVAALDSHGVGRNDRVVIVLPHGPELATACLAVMARSVAAPLNPEYRIAEYEFYLSRLKPRVVLTQANRRSLAEETARTMGIPVVPLLVDGASEAGLFRLESGAESSTTTAGRLPRPGDTALLLHTSGTTGQPRTVPLSHSNLLISVENISKSLRLSSSDRCLHMIPTFHIGGIVDVLAAPLAAGGTVTCASGFSIPEFFNCLREFNPTWTQAVPVMLREILAHCAEYRETIASSSLRFIRSVSAPLPLPVLEELERTFDVPVIEMYGMTETAGLIASNPLPDAVRKPGSVGLPAGPDVRIVDDPGTPVPAGRTGEILVRGGNVMTGYEGADSSDDFIEDWFRTGDEGYLDDDGYLFLTGRIKEIINRGGEKISPREVDEVLHSHPVVADAATFATPHESLGEAVAAAIVLKPGESISRQELIDFLAARLAYFKVPRTIHFVDEIPRTSGGKLQRVKLTATLRSRDDAAQPTETTAVAPQTGVAQALAEMWQRALEVDGVGIHDDFFDLGGDSLKAASFVNELERQWGETVYVSALFDAPTIARLESYLAREYPQLIGKILGRAISPRDRYGEGRSDDKKFETFQELIPRLTTPIEPLRDKNPAAVFVLTAPRSGSTLLRAMLGGHSRLFAPPELYLLSFENLADRKAWFAGSQRFQLEGNIRAIMQIKNLTPEQAGALMEELEQQQLSTWEYYRLMQQWLGDRLLVDKTPFYALQRETLERAEACFREPFYIHLIRHPYGTIRSFEEAHLEQLWYPRIVGDDLARRNACPFRQRELAELIWTTLHQNIAGFLSGVPHRRQYHLKFEELVADPRRAVEGLCRFLGIEFDEAMLRPWSDQRHRMTDGIYPVSRMIGDMKFHRHQSIDSGVADSWKHHYRFDFLCDRTWEVAESLGYDESVAGANQRVEFEI